MSDFEVEGNRRQIIIGSSWKDFDDTIRLYMPDKARRTRFYGHLLMNLVDGGDLSGIAVSIVPDGNTFDLSDERIRREIAPEEE